MSAAPGFIHSRTAILTPGSGISDAAELFISSVEKTGDIIKTTILIDLTGLNSGDTAADIIGNAAAANCHLGYLKGSQVGTIHAARMTCLETPAGGEPDIDLYTADEATGVEDTAITALTNDTALIAAGIDWTTGTALGNVLTPNSTNQFLYLAASGAAPTNATYTAGRFLIELYGS
jgi:hypothetical protein